MMQVRLLIGRRAGTIEDMPFHIADLMLRDGRAERIDGRAIGDKVYTPPAPVVRVETADDAVPGSSGHYSRTTHRVRQRIKHTR